VDLYNHQLPQAALGGKTPLQAMKEWFKSNPELFHRRPYDRPGCDILEVPVESSIVSDGETIRTFLIRSWR